MVYNIITDQCDCYIAFVWLLSKIKYGVLKILYDVMCECRLSQTMPICCSVQNKQW